LVILLIVTHDPKPVKEEETVHDSSKDISHDPYLLQWVIKAIEYALLQIFGFKVKQSIHCCLANEESRNWNS